MKQSHRHIGFGLVWFVVASIILLTASVAHSAEVDVVGKVVVDGEPANGVGLKLLFPDDRTQILTSDKEGVFHFVAEDDQKVAIIPCNEGWPARGASAFLVGGSVWDGTQQVRVPLSTKTVTEQLVVLSSDQEIDWNSAAIGYSVEVPMGKDLPDWTARRTLRPDKLGAVRLNVPDVSGKHRFEIHSQMANGMLATTDQTVTAKDLNRANSYRLPVQLQAPRLVVKAVWSSAAGGGPVKQPEDGNPFVYGLRLAPSQKEAVIDEQGIARFYGVQAGHYTLSLTAAGQKQFSIVSPSDSVNIPAGEAPVVHVAKFEPTVIESLSGLVLEEGTTSGVSTATVEINGSLCSLTTKGNSKSP